MDIEDFYKRLSLGDSSKHIQNTLLQTHWYLSNAVFDSNSGMAIPQNLTDFLKAVRNYSIKRSEEPLRDRIWRIFQHSQKALLHLMDCLNENPKREHKSLPLRDVKELDAACFINLSKRPGLTIREKLASKPHVMAVKRYQSVDLPENQLLKAFAIKLKKLLLLRKKCIIAAGVDFTRFAIFEEEDAVVNRINHWLRSDECKSISRWNNLPPNNTILSHREYKRIWAAWRWMQALPKDVEDDLGHYGFREMTIYNWELLAKIRNGSVLRLVEVPLLFNFEQFSIVPYDGPCIIALLKNNPYKLDLENKICLPNLQFQQQEPKEFEPIQDPVCVDFARVNPIFCHSDIVDVLPYKMLWQKWSMDSKQTLERAILSADIVQSGPGIFTITARDIFASSQADNLDLQQAIFQLSAAFTSFFKSSDFIWLVPDIVNDFQLTSLQSCIHSLYGKEQHVPRSIAAVFEYVDFGEIQKDDEIIVVDRIGDRLFSTRLIVRYSQIIEKKLPEIRGFYFERHISEDIPSIPSECEYRFTGGALEYDCLTGDVLCQKDYQRQRIGAFSGQNKHFLVLGDAPVRGGMNFIKLQARVPSESLWTDCLPDLSTLIPDKNGYCHFYFVKDAKINVKAGQKITLETGNTFILPPFQKQYAFPLYQGRADGRKASEYTALLKSPQFPLQKKITCSLTMTYTYGGKANPYELTFVPNDPEILPITVQWVKTSEMQYNRSDLKYPAYPKPKTWADYENWAGSKNLLNILLRACKSFCEPKRVDYSPNTNTSYSFACGRLKSDIKIDKNGRRYCFVKDGSAKSYFCPERDDHESNCAWDENIDFDSVEYGTEFFFIVKKYQNVKDDSKSKITAICLSLSEEYVKDKLRECNAAEEEKQRTRLEKQKHKTEINRLIQMKKLCSLAIVIWRDGNSLYNGGAPDAFKKTVSSFIKKMESMLEQPDLDYEYQNDIIKFLCILHKDCPQSVREKVENRLANNSNAFQDYKNLAYLIGDCSEPWQKELLYQFISWSKENKFALSCLSIVLWRSENIVFLINMGDCLGICRNLYRNIDRLLEKIKEGLSEQEGEKNKVLSALCRNLEILFAFIRLRGSNDPEKASFFTPNNKISAAFVYELDKLNTVLLEKQLTLRSNLSIRVENKPSGLESMPDIIYSLRTFLTGEMGTICVESVEDEDADLSNMED